MGGGVVWGEEGVGGGGGGGGGGGLGRGEGSRGGRVQGAGKLRNSGGGGWYERIFETDRLRRPCQFTSYKYNLCFYFRKQNSSSENPFDPFHTVFPMLSNV